MAQGKFSNPRPHRDEERQIEKTFRQLTGQEPPSQEDPSVDLIDSVLAGASDAHDAAQGKTESAEETALPFDQPLPEPPAPEQPGPSNSEPPVPPSEEDDFVPEEDSEDSDSPLLERLNQVIDFCSRYKKYVLAGLCGVALLLIVGVIGIFLASASDPYDGKILDNVYLADIPVGGMTKDEAISTVTTITSQTYPVDPMVIDLSGVKLELSPSDTDASLNVKSAVEAAYSYGRTGTQAQRDQDYASSKLQPYVIDLLDYLKLDKDYVLDTLKSYAEDSGSTLTQTTYGLEGDEPKLSADESDETAEPQTLVIHMGTPGIGFDANAVYNQVLEAYGSHQFLVTVDAVEEVKDPDPVNLESIYKEFYIAPVNASLDPKTQETIPGSYGYEFDLEAAQKLVDAAEYGEEIRIPMQYIEPDILDESAFFQDVLGSGKTKHTSNENRTTNLRLACQAINGLILNPGETFSFNDTLGQRTTAKGYKPAPAYSGNELVDEVGGGICQVSSTLYYSALLADMDIVARTNHGFVSTYIDYGMDATVSWGSPDFKFRNSTNYPIKILAEVSGGYVSVQILGTDERDYYVKMTYKITATQEPEIEYKDYAYENELGYKDGDVIEEGVTGYTVKTYKQKYDNQTNQLLSEEYEATSQYKTVNKVVARVEQPPETTVPETTAPPETTVPPVTTAPPETTAPPATTAPPVTTAPPETTAPPATTAPPVTTAPPETTAPPATTAPPVTTTPPAETAAPPAATVSPTVPDETPASRQASAEAA